VTTTTFDERLEAINTAIKRGGGIVAFARHLGCSHQNITQMRQKGYMPPAKALQAEQLTGVSRAKLMKPDLVDAYLSPSSDAADVL